MMIRALLVLFLLPLALTGYSQKVGLVLSGGGAKGLAHIGVLKALEENEIPIDYVVGTSMGGVVAGCYAAGLSPAQIEEIVLSPKFLTWINGRMEQGFNYYYHKNDDHPSFLKLNLSLDSTNNLNFNTSIANDLSLNFALTEIMAQPSAICKGNFDSLFVPLRVVAAEIFTQSEVVLKKGELSDALRATHTVPLFYNPIRVDGKYLFDGGVYNNFPIDVVQREFSPDVIIGSNVSSKVYETYPYKDDDKLISRSLLFMLLDKSDPTRVPPTGVYIQPDLKPYSSFDFAQARGMIDSGYVQTIRQLEELKLKVKARRTCENVAARRNAFNNRTPPLEITRTQFVGFNTKQQRYLNRFFVNKEHQPLFIRDIKSGYYKLVAEDYFKNVYPNISYDSSTNNFDFKLTKRPQNNFQVDFGGVIATRSISNIFLGLNYYYFNRSLTHATLNFFGGSFYKSAQAKARIDISNFGEFYIEPEAIYNSWNFLEGKEMFIPGASPTVLNRIDRKGGASVGLPLGLQYKASMHGYYISNTDQYINNPYLVSTDTLDRLSLAGSRLGINIVTNQLNRKQYPSQGRAYEISLDWFDLREHLEPGNTSTLTAPVDKRRSWLRAKVTLEQYFKKGIYSSGYYLEGVLSNQPTFSNYQGTIINAPAFNPIQDSRTLLLQNFRAFNYIAGGWKNVFSLRKNLDLRLEGYLFKPFEVIEKGQGQEAVLNQQFTKIFFAGTAGLVMHSTVGPISLSINFYDDPENQWGALLHVGFLLFNRTSLE